MNKVEEIKRVVRLGKPGDILKRYCKANEKGEFKLQGQLNLSDVVYLLSENERLKKALLKHGNHTWGCRTHFDSLEEDCSCGWLKMQQALKEKVRKYDSKGVLID